MIFSSGTRQLDEPAEPDLNWLRVLAVHAHPDDEAITTGGTLAALSRLGAQCTVVTCTLGEEGEVVHGHRAHGLVADHADQLGGYRYFELQNSLSALGCTGEILGGLGAYRDSGMASMPSRVAGNLRLIDSQSLAVEDLRETIARLRPQLIVTYDSVGGYGHPDHIAAHDFTVQVLTTEEIGFTGRIAHTVSAQSDIELWTKACEGAPFPEGTRAPRPGELPSVPDSQITHQLVLSGGDLSAKISALKAHKTQLSVVDTETDTSEASGIPWLAFALTNGVCQPVVDTEYYFCRDMIDGRFSAVALSEKADNDGNAPAALFDAIPQP